MSGRREKVTLPMLVDEVLANPGISLRELSRTFGYSMSWLSVVMNSDAFGEMLEARRKELVDPAVAASLNAKLRTLVEVSTEVVTERVEAGADAKLALKAIETATRALGMGRDKTPAVQQTAYIVQVPQRITSSEEWAKTYSEHQAPLTIEMPRDGS